MAAENKPDDEDITSEVPKIDLAAISAAARARGKQRPDNILDNEDTQEVPPLEMEAMVEEAHAESTTDVVSHEEMADMVEAANSGTTSDE